jgi:protein-S-isoprenylcysteine O-methyltransferase Ste14
MHPLLRTLLFTLIVPGTVAGLVPYWLRGGHPFLGGTGAPPWRLWGGGIALLLGGLIYARTAWDFAMTGHGTPSPADPPRTLVARGLYRYSRNPMYVGVLLLVLGQAALAWSGGILVYAIVLAIAFHVRVVVAEEPALRKSFGAEYERYTARVPRWFGTPARSDSPRDAASH